MIIAEGGGRSFTSWFELCNWQRSLMQCSLMKDHPSWLETYLYSSVHSTVSMKHKPSLGSLKHHDSSFFQNNRPAFFPFYAALPPPQDCVNKVLNSACVCAHVLAFRTVYWQEFALIKALLFIINPSQKSTSQWRPNFYLAGVWGVFFTSVLWSTSASKMIQAANHPGSFSQSGHK